MLMGTDKYKWQFAILFAVTLTGLVIYLGLAALMLFASVLKLGYPGLGPDANVGTDFIIACGMLFCGLSLLPAVFYGFQRVTNRPVGSFRTRPVKIWQGLAMGAGWLGAVFLSDFLYQHLQLGWLVVAPFYAISIGLPLTLLVWIGLGGDSAWVKESVLGYLGYWDDRWTVPCVPFGVVCVHGHSCDPSNYFGIQSKLARHDPAVDLATPRFDGYR